MINKIYEIIYMLYLLHVLVYLPIYYSTYYNFEQLVIYFPTLFILVLTCCSFSGCSIALFQLLLPTYTVFQLCALALSFVLSHLTCGGRSGGVARAWWEDGSLRSGTSSLLYGYSYPQPWDSQSKLCHLLPPTWELYLPACLLKSYLLVIYCL